LYVVSAVPPLQDSVGVREPTVLPSAGAVRLTATGKGEIHPASIKTAIKAQIYKRCIFFLAI
jgi:hypothetical protein